jgi:hypothetical protein
MTQWQINLRELFKIVTAGAFLFACVGYWNAGILLGSLLSGAFLLWPSKHDANWAAQVRLSFGALAIAACLCLWNDGGMLIAASVTISLFLLPDFEDENWTLRYVLSNAMIAITIILGVVVSVLRICAGR